MILLVDACVWSLSLRRGTEVPLLPDQQRMLAEFQHAVEEGRASIIGAIRQEVLSGIRDKAKFLKVQRLLLPFSDEPVAPVDYIEAARLFNSCQDHGVQCGAVDMLIAAVAARKKFTVLSYDKGLMRCLGVLGVPHS